MSAFSPRPAISPRYAKLRSSDLNISKLDEAWSTLHEWLETRIEPDSGDDFHDVDPDITRCQQLIYDVWSDLTTKASGGSDD